MSRFLPNNFKLRPADRDWAKTKFKITDEEVERQLELLTDYEFKRSYTDWNRVFRNWIRKADELQQLKRLRVYGSNTPELAPEDTEEEKRKYAENLARLQSMALRIVK